jgi:outer membrane protein assembly factor BamB
MGSGTHGDWNGRLGSMPQMNGGGMQGMEMTLPVADDGTVLVVRRAGSSTVATELAAVRPSGTVAWTHAFENANVASIEIVGTNVVIASHGLSAATTPAIVGHLVALSIASGAQQWKLDLDGYAMGLTPFDGGMYVLVVKPAIQTRTPGSGMPGGDMTRGRTLVAIGNDGKVAWSLPLN